MHATIRGQIHRQCYVRKYFKLIYISFFLSLHSIFLISYCVQDPISPLRIVTDFRDTHPLRFHDFIQTKMSLHSRLTESVARAQSRLRPCRGVDTLRWIHCVSDRQRSRWTTLDQDCGPRISLTPINHRFFFFVGPLFFFGIGPVFDNCLLALYLYGW